MSHDTTGSLTVGVELEFFVASRKPGWQADADPRALLLSEDDGEVDVLEEVRECIETQAKVEAYTEHPHHQNRFTPETGTEFSHWVVKREAMEDDNDDPLYNWHPVEVASAIMSPLQARHRLPVVMDAINSTFLTQVNDQTAFQVHVGCNSAGFPPLTLKKLGTILWLGESRLDRLYAPWRHDVWHAVSIKVSNLAYNSRSHPPSWKLGTDREYLGWLKDIIDEGVNKGKIKDKDADSIGTLWRALGVNDIVEMLKPSSRRRLQPYTGAYSFFNLNGSRQTEGGPVKGTIEFRKPEGTMDPNVAVAWTRVFVKLVDFARLAEKSKFRRVVGKLLRNDEDYKVKDLLMEVGCEEGDVDCLLNKQVQVPVSSQGTSRASSSGGYGVFGEMED